MGGADPYADIDFEEINDLTNLATDEIKCLKVHSMGLISSFLYFIRFALTCLIPSNKSFSLEMILERS